MNTSTILKKSPKRNNPVVITRREYERFIEFKKIKEFNPTPIQKRALLRAEQSLKKGKTFSYNELIGKLGFGN